MRRPLWAKAYVDLPRHPKLIARSDSDKWLWICLFLHGKEHTFDGIIRDLTPRDMRNMFNIKASVRKVKLALDYFIEKKMLVPVKDGLLIRDFVERQAKFGDTPEDHARRQAKYRRGMLNDVSVTSSVTSRVTSRDGARSDADVDLDVDPDEDQDLDSAAVEEIKPRACATKSPPPPAAPTAEINKSDFARYVAATWPGTTITLEAEQSFREAAPNVDLLFEAKQARAWEVANGKTHGVPAAFLRSWITREQRAIVDGGRDFALIRGGGGRKPTNGKAVLPGPAVPSVTQTAELLARQNEQAEAARREREDPDKRAKVKRILAAAVGRIGNGA
jgi:hypothetical protein